MTKHAFYYFLDCANLECKAQLRLPEPMLRLRLGIPATQAIGDASVVVSCHRCKHVAIYDLRNTVGTIQEVAPVYVFAEFLRCEERSCRTRLGVIAVRNSDMTDEERERDVGMSSQIQPLPESKSPGSSLRGLPNPRHGLPNQSYVRPIM